MRFLQTAHFTTLSTKNLAEPDSPK